jgi:hypothetical protein
MNRIQNSCKAIFGAVALFALADRVGAVGLTLTDVPAPPTQVTDLTGFQTTGADMGGKMNVTAFFIGGGSETVPWLATGPAAGAAIGTNWSLQEAGDTFNPGPVDGVWALNVKSDNVQINRLLLVGVPPVPTVQTDGVVFDRTFGDAFGTAGSYRGRDFKPILASGPWDLDVKYVSEVDSLADGLGAQRDIWGQLDINFTGATAPGFFTLGHTLTFLQDTDTVGLRIPGPCDPASGECPEPGTAMTLFVVAGLGLMRRRAAR